MITIQNLNGVFIRKRQKVGRHLNLENGKVFIQDYNGSFYYYEMRTRHDNANRSTGLFCFDKNRVHFRKLWIDTATKPMIARVEVGKSELLSENPKKRDKRFAEMIEKCCGEESYSNLYLIGEGFDKEWAVDSLTVLCKNQRRVYYGNNLYVRGACFAALEKSEDKTLGNYLYVGEALVKNHITMNMNIQGKDQIYIETKIGSILKRLPEIDEQIHSICEGWRLERLGKPELAILRLAVYEITNDANIPTGVAINEAVELAKIYCSEEAPRFVNGVLAKLA